MENPASNPIYGNKDSGEYEKEMHEGCSPIVLR